MSCNYVTSNLRDKNGTSCHIDSVGGDFDHLNHYTEQFISSKVPPIVFRLYDSLIKYGAKDAYIVGGVGRDIVYSFLKGDPPEAVDNSDIDIEVHGLDFKTVVKAMRELGQTQVARQTFVVAKLFYGHTGEYLDVSVPRYEQYVGQFICTNCSEQFPYTDLTAESRDKKICPSCRQKTLEDVGDRNEYSVTELSEDYLNSQGYNWQTDDELLDISRSIAVTRRDTKMNGLMVSLRDHMIYDNCGGISDIREELVDAIDEKTFPQDLLRFYRVARQASKFGFSISPRLYRMASENVSRIPNLEPGRITAETIKMFGSGKRFSECLDFMEKTGWMKFNNFSNVKANIRKFESDGGAVQLNNVERNDKDIAAEKNKRRRAVWVSAILFNGEPEGTFENNCRTTDSDFKSLNSLYRSLNYALSVNELTEQNIMSIIPDSQHPDYFSYQEIMEARRILGKPMPTSEAKRLVEKFGFVQPEKIINGNRIEEMLNKQGIFIAKSKKKAPKDGKSVIVRGNIMSEIDSVIRSKQLTGEIASVDEAEKIVSSSIFEIKQKNAPD